MSRFAKTCFVTLAILSNGEAIPASAVEDPIVIKVHLAGEVKNTPSGQSIPSTDTEKAAALPTPHSNPTIADTPADDAVNKEVFWGYAKPSKNSVPRIKRTVRAKPPWAYKATNKGYTPKPHREYQRKRDWTYRPKRSFRYHAKSDWTYHARNWRNR
ncbi:MAG: hypothetical protein DHS20C16_14760 [Phycisphaerae bacterium]|nr:MAG: hypothetical protein DHS20C16_14760 [Phycisphaerae bacterium]